jgi:hypothetical protein
LLKMIQLDTQRATVWKRAKWNICPSNE